MSAEISSSSLNVIDNCTRNFNIGTLVVTMHEENLHYIKAEIVIDFKGRNSSILKNKSAKLKDLLNTYLMKLTINKAKEDYITHKIHRDLKEIIDKYLAQRFPKMIEVKEVLIPTFLIN